MIHPEPWTLLVMHLIAQGPHHKTIDWSLTNDFQTRAECDAQKNYMRQQKGVPNPDGENWLILCIPSDELRPYQ